jgi:hypothetical protein
MSEPDNEHHQAAIQYLGWAIEELEKAGNHEAADHARAALKCLHKARPSRTRRPVRNCDLLE